MSTPVGLARRDAARRSATRRRRACGLALLTMTTVAAALASVGSPAGNAAEPVAQRSPAAVGGWRLEARALTAAEKAEATFDPSGWGVAAAAPFGTSGGPCDWNTTTASPPHPALGTVTTLGEIYGLRTTFALPPGATDLRFAGILDNTADVYLNGQAVGTATGGTCTYPRDDFSALTVADSVLNTGQNYLSVQFSDDGETAAYLGFEISYVAQEYSVTASPTTIAKGRKTDVALTVTNEGDANLTQVVLTLPAGLDVDGSPSQGTAVDNTVTVTGLDVAPDASTVVTIPVRAGCDDDSATASWTTSATAITGAHNVADEPTTTVTGTCSVAFVTQPGKTKAGDPVAVSAHVLAGDGSVIEDGSQPISIAKASGSGPGTLSSTDPTGTVDGVASFAPTIDLTGKYRLDATSPNATTATSDEFTVYVDCNGTCQFSSGTENVKIANPTPTGGEAVLVFSNLLSPDPRCAGYTPNTSLVTFEVTGGDGNGLFELTFTKAGLTGKVNKYKFCLTKPADGSEGTFTDASGNKYVTAGFLPNCKPQGKGKKGTAPCILHRDSSGGAVNITVLLEAGDPAGWF